MVASESFSEFLREQLAPLGRLTMRRMFGKTGVFCDDAMFGMVTENTLYLRVDEESRETFKEAEAYPPLNYEKGGSIIDLSFWRVPERLFDEPEEFVAWARAALAAAHRVAAKRKRTTPKRKSGAQRVGADLTSAVRGPTGRANAGPITGSAISGILFWSPHLAAGAEAELTLSSCGCALLPRTTMLATNVHSAPW